MDREKYVILDNVLDKDALVFLQNYFIKQQNEREWFYTDNLIAPKKSNVQSFTVKPGEVETKVGDGFVIQVPNERTPINESAMAAIDIIRMIVADKLNTHFTHNIRTKVNLTKPQTFGEQDKLDAIHIDRERQHTSFIFYINTNDGYTLLYDDDRKTVIEKVDCVENRVLVFDGLIPHAGVPSTNNDKCIINFNVIENNNNNNMSNQLEQAKSNPYTRTQKIEYKTLFNTNVGQLDDEIIQHLNDGWMPHGPQYYVVNQGWFVQPVLKVPQQMMQR